MRISDLINLDFFNCKLFLGYNCCCAKMVLKVVTYTDLFGVVLYLRINRENRTIRMIKYKYPEYGTICDSNLYG